MKKTSLFLTALLFIAASAMAQTTHTVCASGCDFTTIQAAINAATAGDVIEVGAGTYNYITEGSPAPAGLIKVTKGVTIKAATGARPIIDGSNFDGIFKIHPSALLPGNTVKIEGFELTGNLLTGIAITMQGCFDVTPAHVVINDNWFHGMLGGIHMWGASSYLPSGWTSAVANVEITNNKFYNLVHNPSGTEQGFGLLLYGAANWATAGNDYAYKVENNEFSNIQSNNINPGVGIAIDHMGETWQAANVYISGNKFTTVPAGIIINDGDVTDTKIENNGFISNSAYAVLVQNVENSPVNATCNWWGTNDADVIPTKIFGPVTWVPFWVSDEGPCLQKMFELKIGN